MTANCRVRYWTTTGVFARDLRLRLLREHLDRAADGSEDDGLVDPGTVVETIARHRRMHWKTGTQVVARDPGQPGRLRPHRPEKLGLLTRLWAVPVYRRIYDPDGRSYRARLKGEW